MTPSIVDWQPMETIPEEGQFLVWLEKPLLRSLIHVASWHPNVKIIGSLFHFDAPKPIAWSHLPKGPNGEDGNAPD